MINTHCPISGNKASKTQTITYQGVEIGFCGSQHRIMAAKILSVIPQRTFLGKMLTLPGLAMLILGALGAHLASLL